MERCGHSKAIFEGAFFSPKDGAYCRVDVLAPTPQSSPDDPEYDMLEVKSSTRVKQSQVIDATLQAHALAKSGVPIRAYKLLLIDRTYVLGDEPVDPADLFTKRISRSRSAKAWQIFKLG